MANTNARMLQRIDSIENWTTTNPMIKPGEMCFIEGTPNYRVNLSSIELPFTQCQLMKGAEGSGRTTLQDYTQTWSAYWNADQANNKTITLPNIVEDAHVDYPKDKVLDYMDNDWATPGRPISQPLPNSVPTDLLLTLIREICSVNNLDMNATEQAVRDTLNLIRWQH